MLSYIIFSPVISLLLFTRDFLISEPIKFQFGNFFFKKNIKAPLAHPTSQNVISFFLYFFNDLIKLAKHILDF